jgi:hypothetical protein
LQRQAVLFFAGPQRLLGQLTVGDIHRRPGHVQQGAIGGDQ